MLLIQGQGIQRIFVQDQQQVSIFIEAFLSCLIKIAFRFDIDVVISDYQQEVGGSILGNLDQVLVWIRESFKADSLDGILNNLTEMENKGNPVMQTWARSTLDAILKSNEASSQLTLRAFKTKHPNLKSCLEFDFRTTDNRLHDKPLDDPLDDELFARRGYLENLDKARIDYQLTENDIMMLRTNAARWKEAHVVEKKVGRWKRTVPVDK